MGDLIKREQGIAKSGNINPVARLRVTKEGGEYAYQISMYTGVPATKEKIQQALQAVSLAFPTYTPERLAMLSQFLFDRLFTEERIHDAVTYVIANCRYKEPAIADFTTFDKCVKLYTYSEYCRLVQTIADPHDVKYYGKINGVHLYYRESELQRFRAMR